MTAGVQADVLAPPLSLAYSAPPPPIPVETKSTAEQECAEYLGKLAQATPTIPVTQAIIGINVVVFLLMLLSGVHLISPTADVLVSWGASYGPLTKSGQWWRLFTCMFLHYGIVHIALNMWVLWDVGQLVERMFGNARFALLYFVSGWIGSIASVMWNPTVASAGASGAIFGVYGALLCLLLRGHDKIPTAVLLHLRNSTVGFVGFNILYGLTQPNIDMAAHIGGLIGGALCALVILHLDAQQLSRPHSSTTVSAPSTSIPSWYWSRNGQQVGPVTEEQLRQMWLSGQLLASDDICKEGTTEWAKASTLWANTDLVSQVKSWFYWLSGTNTKNKVALAGTVCLGILVLLVKMGGDHPDVQMVKGGRLTINERITVEQAVNRFMGSPKWEAGISDTGQHFVNVTGAITYMDKPVTALIQFHLAPNKKTFEFHALEFNGIPQNAFIAAALLGKMFNDE